MIAKLVFVGLLIAIISEGIPLSKNEDGFEVMINLRYSDTERLMQNYSNHWCPRSKFLISKSF